MGERNDEFYVGYLERSPPGIAARTRMAVLVAFVVGLLLAVILVFAQSRFDQGTFEFNVDREFLGVVVERPYPMLRVPAEDGTSFTSHFLVDSGKHGSQARVKGLDGEAVRVTGSRIANDRAQMIEVHAVERLGDADARQVRRPEPIVEPLGVRTFIGEIVDAKCHLGVMKPGRGKPHRACAIRCISGGIPPVLRVQDDSGNVEYLILVALDGSAVNDEVLDLVADPVEITGRVTRTGDRLTLHADPATYRRLDTGGHDG